MSTALDQAYADVWNGKPWALMTFIRELEKFPLHERFPQFNGAHLELIVAVPRPPRIGSAKFFVTPDIEGIMKKVAGDDFDERFTTNPADEEDVGKRLREFFDGLRASLIAHGYLPE